MSGSKRSREPEAVGLAELIANLRLQPHGLLSLGNENGRFEISAEDWNFILDGAQEKLDRRKG